MQRKSILLTYILWFFLGSLGIHRIYCNRAGSGVAMLLLTIVGTITTFILIGWVLLAIVAIWWILDAILIFTWFRN